MNLPHLTWDELRTFEPKLIELEHEAHVLKSLISGPYCLMAHWHGWGAFRRHGLKQKLTRIIGWERNWPDEDEATEQGEQGEIIDLRLVELPVRVYAEGEDRRLYGHVAYDVASRELLAALPVCCGPCGCPQ